MLSPNLLIFTTPPLPRLASIHSAGSLHAEALRSEGGHAMGGQAGYRLFMPRTLSGAHICVPRLLMPAEQVLLCSMIHCADCSPHHSPWHAHTRAWVKWRVPFVLIPSLNW